MANCMPLRIGSPCASTSLRRVPVAGTMMFMHPFLKFPWTFSAARQRTERGTVGQLDRRTEEPAVRQTRGQTDQLLVPQPFMLKSASWG